MKKAILEVVVLVAIIGLSFLPEAFCDPGMEGMQPATDPGLEFRRGVDNVAARGDKEDWDIFERWGALIFGERTIDPFASTEELTETQEINEGVGERAETMAEFTENAATVVSAGAASPHAVSTAGSLAVGEAVSEATSEEPGFFESVGNAIGSFFGAIGDALGLN